MAPKPRKTKAVSKNLSITQTLTLGALHRESRLIKTLNTIPVSRLPSAVECLKEVTQALLARHQLTLRDAVDIAQIKKDFHRPVFAYDDNGKQVRLSDERLARFFTHKARMLSLLGRLEVDELARVLNNTDRAMTAVYARHQNQQAAAFMADSMLHRERNESRKDI